MAHLSLHVVVAVGLLTVLSQVTYSTSCHTAQSNRCTNEPPSCGNTNNCGEECRTMRKGEEVVITVRDYPSQNNDCRQPAESCPCREVMVQNPCPSQTCVEVKKEGKKSRKKACRRPAKKTGKSKSCCKTRQETCPNQQNSCDNVGSCCCQDRRNECPQSHQCQTCTMRPSCPSSNPGSSYLQQQYNNSYGHTNQDCGCQKMQQYQSSQIQGYEMKPSYPSSNSGYQASYSQQHHRESYGQGHAAQDCGCKRNQPYQSSQSQGYDAKPSYPSSNSGYQASYSQQHHNGSYRQGYPSQDCGCQKMQPYQSSQSQSYAMKPSYQSSNPGYQSSYSQQHHSESYGQGHIFQDYGSENQPYQSYEKQTCNRQREYSPPRQEYHDTSRQSQSHTYETPRSATSGNNYQGMQRKYVYKSQEYGEQDEYPLPRTPKYEEEPDVSYESSKKGMKCLICHCEPCEDPINHTPVYSRKYEKQSSPSYSTSKNYQEVKYQKAYQNQYEEKSEYNPPNPMKYEDHPAPSYRPSSRNYEESKYTPPKQEAYNDHPKYTPSRPSRYEDHPEPSYRPSSRNYHNKEDQQYQSQNYEEQSKYNPPCPSSYKEHPTPTYTQSHPKPQDKKYRHQEMGYGNEDNSYRSHEEPETPYDSKPRNPHNLRSQYY